MSLSINTNLASLTAQRNQSTSQNELSTAIARLSSGLRINSAKDDAAGLAIADRFTSQIRGVNQAGRNANDGISLAQTAEGALASIGDNLQRIRELSVQSANATNSSSDRASLQLEVSQLQSEIDRVATQTQFNGLNLLDGSFTAKQFQVGANVGQTINVASIASARSSALGLGRGFTGTVASSSYSSGLASLTASSPFTGPLNLGLVALDGKAIAAALSNAGVTGLSAAANVATKTGQASVAAASAAGTATLRINGVAIALAGSIGAAALAGNRAQAVAAINAQSAATGVSAREVSGRVDLSSADGRNIEQVYAAGSFSGSSTLDFGLGSDGTAGATVGVTYVAPPAATGWFNISLYYFDAYGGTDVIDQDMLIGSTGTSIAAADISSAAGANAAIASVDTALRTVNAARASLGAVQNRFASTARNLQASGHDITASRSRVADADFALETANMARSQILQQAGTAMIGQANLAPSQVLSLLR